MALSTTPTIALEKVLDAFTGIGNWQAEYDKGASAPFFASVYSTFLELFEKQKKKKFSNTVDTVDTVPNPYRTGL
tara:strand:- start:196 stop:420 length:225 start_codon:yes stop_codon:yes gene_type:complete